MAILEIGVGGYENTFFDSYDSYLHVENNANQNITVDHRGGIDSGENCRITFVPAATFGFCIPSEEVISDFPCYKQKLFLAKSSLLI